MNRKQWRMTCQILKAKSFISKVQINMRNAINDDDEIVETDHGTDDIDEIERKFPCLKCYNCGWVHIVREILRLFVMQEY